MKECSKCKVSKDEDDFHRDLTRTRSLRSVCKRCDLERRAIYERDRRKRDSEYSQRRSKLHLGRNNTAYNKLRRELLKVGRWHPAFGKKSEAEANRIGLTVKLLKEKKKQSKGLCQICEVDVFSVVDHDHKINRFRGLLCHPCNLGLGWFRDNPERLRKAAQYIEKFWAAGEVADGPC